MTLPDSPILQQLHHLDKSSSGFRDQLSNILYGEEYRQCVPNLQDDGSIWLINYLDEVRSHVAITHSPLTPLEVLDCLDPSCPAFRKCLRELGSTCGTGGVLPASYTLSAHLLNIASAPFASGGYGDVYEGTLDGSGVCVKYVRVYTKDDPKKAAKVLYQQHRRLPVRHR